MKRPIVGAVLVALVGVVLSAVPAGASSPPAFPGTRALELHRPAVALGDSPQAGVRTTSVDDPLAAREAGVWSVNGPGPRCGSCW